MIYENMVLMNSNAAGERIRIIYVSEEYEEVAFINIDDVIAVPKRIKLGTINDEVENNLLVKNPDPYFRSIDEGKLSDTDKLKREENWALISDAWENKKDELLNKKTRTQVYEDIANKSGMPLITIRRLFSRFWQRQKCVVTGL